MIKKSLLTTIIFVAIAVLSPFFTLVWADGALSLVGTPQVTPTPVVPGKEATLAVQVKTGAMAAQQVQLQVKAGQSVIGQTTGTTLAPNQTGTYSVRIAVQADARDPLALTIWGQGVQIGQLTLKVAAPTVASPSAPAMKDVSKVEVRINQVKSVEMALLQVTPDRDRDTSIITNVTLESPASGTGQKVILASNSPSVIVPSDISIAPGALTGTFYAKIPPNARHTTATISASVAMPGAVTKQTTIKVGAFNVVPVQSITFEPPSVVFGGMTEMVIRLTRAVPPGPTFYLDVSNSHPGVVSPPSSVFFREHTSTWRSQLITSTSVTADTTVTITAGDKTGQLLVKALAIESVTIEPSSVPGGDNSKTIRLKVQLNGEPRREGFSVPITISDPSLVSPLESPIPFGASQKECVKSFTSTTRAPLDKTVTITVGSGTAAKTATLTLKAPRITGIELSDTRRLGSGTPFPIVGGSGNRLTIDLKTDIGSPPGGLVIALSSSDPVVIPVPTSFTIPEGQMNNFFNVEPISVSNDTRVTITARQGPNTKTADVVVKAISPQNLSLRPRRGGTDSTVVLNGDAVVVSVNLNAPAPPGGLLVPLTSSHPSILSVPATMYFGQNIVSTEIESTTSLVTQNTPVTITAGRGTGAKTASITVRPLTIESLSVFPQNVTSGMMATGSVTLTGPAPSDSFIVPLTSSNPSILPVQESVKVASGQTSASFSVTAQTVRSRSEVTIRASYAGVEKTSTVYVNP